MTLALIAARDARIDERGAVLLEGLSFEADGARVGLLGNFAPVFALFARRATLARGSVTVLGRPAESAVATNTLGLAPLDPVAPEPWTCLEYLSTSAGLLGLSRRAANRTAEEALGAIDSAALGKRKIATLSDVERRLLFVAHALLGAPPAIFVENPLARLPDDAAAVLREALERAAAGRRLIVSVTSPAGAGPELNLLASMDRIVAMEGGAVVAVGPPDEALSPSPRCVVRTARKGRALAEILAARGFRIDAETDPPEEAARFVVHLPAGATTMSVVEVALEVDAPLLELVPVGLDPPG